MMASALLSEWIRWLRGSWLLILPLAAFSTGLLLVFDLRASPALSLVLLLGLIVSLHKPTN